MRVRESVEVARPPEEVYAMLSEPERRREAGAWRDLARTDDGYRAKLRGSAGAVRLDFDCRFSVEPKDNGRVRIHGDGVSPRLAFTFDGSFDVEGSERGSTVEVDVDVRPSGPLAGLGQRGLREQARRLVGEFLTGA